MVKPIEQDKSVRTRTVSSVSFDELLDTKKLSTIKIIPRKLIVTQANTVQNVCSFHFDNYKWSSIFG